MYSQVHICELHSNNVTFLCSSAICRKLHLKIYYKDSCIKDSESRYKCLIYGFIKCYEFSMRIAGMRTICPRIQKAAYISSKIYAATHNIR